MAFISLFYTEVAFDKVSLLLMMMTVTVVMSMEMMLLCPSSSMVLAARQGETLKR